MEIDIKPSVIFLITDRCNLKCPFCFVEERRGRLDVDFDSFRAVLARRRPLLLQLSGGEPTVHREFPRLLEHALARVPAVTISTNGAGGWQRYRWLARLRRKPMVGFSLDAPDERHDAIRAKKGLFSNIMDAASRLKRRGVPVAFNATITGPGDFDSFPEGNIGMADGLIDLAQQMRIPINIQPYHLTAADTRRRLGLRLLSERSPWVIGSRPFREMLVDGPSGICRYNLLNVSVGPDGEPLPTWPGNCYFSPDCKRCYYSCVWEPTFLASARAPEVAANFVSQYFTMQRRF